MKKIVTAAQAIAIAIIIILLAFVLVPRIAYSETYFQCNGDSLCDSNYWNYWGTVSLSTQSDSPEGTAGVWMWTFEDGTPGGEGIASLSPSSSMPDGTQEVWMQWWWKYSLGFDWHPIGDKQMYFQPSNVIGMVLVAGPTKLRMTPQGPNIDNYEPNVNLGSWYCDTGNWHKFKARYKWNSAGNWDGIYQAWIDDIMVSDYNNVYYGDNGEGLTAGGVLFAVIWGGAGGVLSGTHYLYIDGVYIGSTDGSGYDVSPPYTLSHSPVRGATGVPIATTSHSFSLRDDRTDDTGTVQGSISMTGPDGTKTCSTGTPALTCTGSASNYSITYPGISLSYEEVASFTLTATDVQGNVLNDSWSWTAEPSSSLTITTQTLPSGTVGTVYSQTVLATGGATPYTFSLLSGSLPPGLDLSSAGVISGTPTGTGTSNFTVKVLDTVAATDNQALSLYVAPAAPTGQTTIEILVTADTFIDSGTPGVNYESSTALRTYQWPYATVANRILDNISLAAIPSNVNITAATLEMYLTGYDGSGGTNPMRVYVYRVTGTVPNIATVTWNNFAGTLGTAESYTDVSLISGWFFFDVTNSVQSAHSAGSPLYLAQDGRQDGAQDTNRIFASADHGTAAWRPRLKVTYTLLTEPPPAFSTTTPGKVKLKSGTTGRWRSFK